MRFSTNITGTTKAGLQVGVYTDERSLDETLALIRSLAGPNPVQELADAGERFMEHVITEAQIECPVAPDGGTLRASAHVQPAEISGTKVSVRAGFGGPAIPYALRQHEELTYRHTVGKAKYLEDPTRRLGAKADQEIAADIRAQRAA